jgi:hypothetical protein
VSTQNKQLLFNSLTLADKKTDMRKAFFLITALFLAIATTYGQTATHYVKFFHVGEKVMPVNTLNITYQDGDVPRDPAQKVIDTLKSRQITTDERTYDILLSYVKHSNYKLGTSPGKLNFGTFKIIFEGSRYYVPGRSCTAYFKDMVAYLKKRKCDPEAIQGITDNYPWIFNP